MAGQDVFDKYNGLVVDRELISRPIVLAAGQNLRRGALLGQVTATRAYVISASGATDGSQVPDCILAEDTDATSADVATLAHFVGTVRQQSLILGEGQTIEAIAETLRAKRIRLVPG